MVLLWSVTSHISLGLKVPAYVRCCIPMIVLLFRIMSYPLRYNVVRAQAGWMCASAKGNRMRDELAMVCSCHIVISSYHVRCSVMSSCVISCHVHIGQTNMYDCTFSTPCHRVSVQSLSVTCLSVCHVMWCLLGESNIYHVQNAVPAVSVY